MPQLLMHIRAIGWAAVEAAVLLIVLCMLLDIVIGAQADSFISHVNKNAIGFLQSVPPGTVVGLALVVAVYGFLKTRLCP